MSDAVPQNLEAEQSVLGSLLLDPEAMAKVAPILRPADFFRGVHRTVYAAAEALYKKGSAVDIALVAGELGEERLARVGGHAFLAELANQPSSCTLAADYAQQVKAIAVRRRLIQAGGAVAAAAYEADGAVALDQAQRLLATIATDAGAVKPPPTMTAAELLAKQFPDARDVVPGIVYEGLTILASRPKLGKTWLMLGTAVAVAAGGHALGATRVEEGDVLYLALEDGEKRLQKRLRQLLGDQAPPARLHLATAFPLLDEGGEEALERWLVAHPEARLVVIDTLKRFRPREKAGASIYNLDYDAVAPLADLAHRHGVAIVVVHHCRKSDAEDPLDLISGTTGLTGGADGAIVLKRARGQAEAELHVTHRDADDGELALRWDEQLSGWRLLGDAEEHRRSDERLALLTLLHDAGEPVTCKDAAEVLKKNYSTIRWLLWQMAKDGEVKREGPGYVPLAPRPSVAEGEAAPTAPTPPTAPTAPTPPTLTLVGPPAPGAPRVNGTAAVGGVGSGVGSVLALPQESVGGVGAVGGVVGAAEPAHCDHCPRPIHAVHTIGTLTARLCREHDYRPAGGLQGVQGARRADGHPAPWQGGP